MGLFTKDTVNPFKEAEERMHQKMMKAEGQSPDETFVRKMIEHHRGGIEAGEILLQEGSDEQLKKKVRESMQHQEKEIGELQSWLGEHGHGQQ